MAVPVPHAPLSRASSTSRSSIGSSWSSSPASRVLTGETGAGKTILVEAIGLLVGGRASADLVRTGEDQATVQADLRHPRRPRGDRPPRDLAQGRSRAFIDDALATSAALREPAAASSTCTASTNIRSCSIPQRTSTCSTRSAASARRCERRPPAPSPPGARARRARPPRRRRAREGGARRDPRASSSTRSRRSRRSRRGRRADRDAPGPRQRRQAAAALRRGLHRALRGDDAALPALGIVWKRVGELAALDAALRAVPRARDASKSQLEDLAFFLRSYAADLDASPERLQEIEDRLAALERLKGSTARRSTTCSARRRSCAGELARPRARSRTRRRSWTRQLADAREAYLAAAAALSTRAGATAAGASRAGSSAPSPSWR